MLYLPVHPHQWKAQGIYIFWFRCIRKRNEINTWSRIDQTKRTWLFVIQVHIYLYYGSLGCQVWRYKIRSFFVNIPRGNYRMLRIGVVVSCQKIGHHFINKVIKNVPLNLYSSIRKMRKLQLKKWERFGWFLT